MVLGEMFGGVTRRFEQLFHIERINKRRAWTQLQKMHSPGIEPGTSAWKADILPLNYECLLHFTGMQ
eukprot:scaffold1384_cov116-Cylindrotheca_fusiformis.AAC.36